MNAYETGTPALVVDLYELTMMQGYYRYQRDRDVVFDMFFRQEPFGGGYAVFAGLEPLADIITRLRFSKSDLEYLGSLGLFAPDFLEYLAGFRFRGDLYAVEEGEIVFPKEPLLRVHGNILEAQFIESIVLNMINFQTLIATKTARISGAAQGKGIIEFGLRRAQGVDGALSASRAAFIGGAIATSNVEAGKRFSIPVTGTMAHSWVMAFPTELEAFSRYARQFPGHTTLLVDTYNTLKYGVPDAIAVMKKLRKQGVRNFGVRLDSGDTGYLSAQARRMLDAAGLGEAKIIASNELDEYRIEQLMNKKAPVDFFGVGTRLVTAYGDPALSGIYKLVARKEGGRYVPLMKISDDPGKMTNPSIKNVLRLFDSDGRMAGDLIFLEQERRTIEKAVARRAPLDRYDPDSCRRQRAASRYDHGKVLLKPVIEQGEVCAPFPDLHDVQRKTKEQWERLPSSCRLLLDPQVYPVSIGRRLREVKARLINKQTKRRMQ
jgi:nicotinate phosphoribosyltransferase